MLLSASDKDLDHDSDSSDDAPSYSNVSIYPNDQLTLKPCSRTALRQVEKFAARQSPVSDTVGARVSYLSAETCPVKAWIGMEPHSNAPLSRNAGYSGLLRPLSKISFRNIIRSFPRCAILSSMVSEIAL